MLGGLPRRASFIEQLRRERKNVLLVDTGDMLFSRPPAQGPYTKKMADLKTDLYMKTYNLMGYDAITPGELDLFFRVDNVLQMSKQAFFPFLAANLIDTKSGKPVFKPYLIKEMPGIKVGLLGLISRRYPLGPPEEKEKYSLADPIERAQKIVPQLKKKKCQVIAVLGHMEDDEKELLAKAVPGIHFILSGHNPNYYLQPMQANNSQIFVAGARGENLGKVDFLIEKKKLHSHYQLVALTSKYADHPQAQEMLNQYKTTLQELLRTSPQVGFRIRPKVAPRETAVLSAPSFVGERVCLDCHQQEYQSWLTTSHASAYQTLAQQGKSSDPTCLACHSTGYGESRNPPGISLENVQCEACHGAGEGHPEPRKSLLRISENQCLKCHNPSNSPKFNYADYLQKIRHQK
ncbi:MAG: hypothetical protein HY882_04730 [Deltaproteobacteria bacterium]|nr:hypothetical protein [Deltaproteobacteria bacterium]